MFTMIVADGVELRPIILVMILWVGGRTPDVRVVTCFESRLELSPYRYPTILCAEVKNLNQGFASKNALANPIGVFALSRFDEHDFIPGMLRMLPVGTTRRFSGTMNEPHNSVLFVQASPKSHGSKQNTGFPK